MEGDSEETIREKQQDALQRAKESAAAHNPKEMLTALYESGFLDGLPRGLKRRWDKLPAYEIDFIIGQAVDILYKNVSSGEAILNLPAYLYRVAHNLACDRYRQLQEQGAYEIGKEESEEGDEEPKEVTQQPWDYLADDSVWEERRLQAISAARSLLPKLGQQNIQKVMALIFDGVESGIQDLTNEKISETLGLSLDTVKTSKSRGFRRLARVAREEGLVKDEAEIINILGQEAEEHDEQDD